jgi:gluconokinase
MRAYLETRFWLVMGVAGSGKTSVAQGLAAAVPGVCLDADDYHPRINIERMRAGQPLGDADRWPWLAAVAEAALRAQAREGRPVFVACSALKRAYRDLLRERLPGLRTVFLDGEATLIHQRLSQRRDHYMAPGMLASQLADLEPPEGEPGVVRVDVTQPLEAVLQAVLGPATSQSA